jgi:hypothetical protein
LSARLLRRLVSMLQPEGYRLSATLRLRLAFS